MLVVIGVLVALVAILTPAINIAYRGAMRSRMQFDLQSISSCLEAYKNDTRSYPLLDRYNGANPMLKTTCPSAALLYMALIGPNTAAVDGHTGAGFTIIPNGNVYGPYVDPTRFKALIEPPGVPPPLNGTANGSNNVFIDGFADLCDRYGHPIVYLLAATGTQVNPKVSYAAYQAAGGAGIQVPVYNYLDAVGLSPNTNTPFYWPVDASPTVGGNGLIRFQLMLGDLDANGVINKTAWGIAETPVNSGPFILWSAGPDELFGVDVTSPNYLGNPQSMASEVPGCDDVRNF